MPDTLFIINPVSSRGTTLKRWHKARLEINKSRINFKEHITTSAGDATRATRQAIMQGVRQVIAVGGDGTLSEVVNGYFNESGQAIDPAARIGLLPSGTGSDFSRSVNLTKTEDSIRALIELKSRLLDVMRVEYRDEGGERQTRFAINLVSFGLGGEVVSLVNSWRGKLPDWIGGRTRFIAAAICALGGYRLKRVRVVFEDTRVVEVKSNLIIVGNGRFAGNGMMFAPDAELDDGLLEVILTDGATRFDVIKELPGIFQGRYLKNPKVSQHQSLAVSITAAEKLAIDIDGEAAGYAPAKLSIIPASVQFIC